LKRPNQLSRRRFASLAAASGLLETPLSAAPSAPEIQEAHPGVLRITVGSPEELTPGRTRRYAAALMVSLPSARTCPLPLAEPALHIEDEAGWQLTVQLYRKSAKPAVLYEDNGSPNAQITEVTLSWDHETGAGFLERRGQR
jgi:hypothetical protein